MRRLGPASCRSSIAAARSCAAAVLPFLLLSLVGCDLNTAPPGPPYLAIVTNLYAVGNATLPTTIAYRVQDLGSGALPQRTLRAAPNDTVILSVRPAAYQVEVEGLPSRCVISDGPARAIILPEGTNTGIVRYSIQCRGVVTIGVITDGPERDSSFVYLVRDANGAQYTGLVGANDTVTVDNAGAGDYEVRLGGIAANCVVVSDGGVTQRVSVTATGGALLSFRVSCAALADRPQLLSLVSGFDKGASIFTFRVWDPNGDVEGYTWDITDCNGSSVLPDKRERIRRGLRSGRGQLNDTLTVVGGYELLMTPQAVTGRCTEIRVFDERFNTSVVLTHRIGSATGFAPAVRFFNATLEGQVRINSLLLASDAENDIVGHFVMVRLRDGVLGAQDGREDLGSMDPAGYIGLEVPSVPTTGRIAWDDVRSIIVYVIDAKGNVVRVEDADIFR